MDTTRAATVSRRVALAGIGVGGPGPALAARAFGAGAEPAFDLVTQVLMAGEPRLMPADMDMGGTPAA